MLNPGVVVGRGQFQGPPEMPGALGDRPFLHSGLQDLSNELGDRLPLGRSAASKGFTKCLVSADGQDDTHEYSV